MTQKLFTIILFTLLSVGAKAQDLMPVSTVADGTNGQPLERSEIDASAYRSPGTSDDISATDSLTLDNLCRVLDRYEVKFKRIVAAQAILETGHFSSSLCKRSHNLFGLRRPSDGSYYEFSSWQESVRAYRDYVQYKYSDGDYYSFLNRIGYAQDQQYTSKVRRIAQGLTI